MTASPDRITWGFSSLGAPELSLQELSALAREYGLDFLELRAVAGTTALPDYFRDHPEDLSTSTEIRVVSSDLRLTEATDESIAVFLRYAELAEKWKAPYLRVFGGGSWDNPILEHHLHQAAETLKRCRKLLKEGGFSCEMLLETHSGFSSATMCRKLNEILDQPVGIIWDSHHTWKLAGESMRKAWSEIGQWVRHIHYKDSLLDSTAKAGYRYVFPGQGEFPTRELMELLNRVGYKSGLSLEWEKLWHPELPEISGALACFKSACSR